MVFATVIVLCAMHTSHADFVPKHTAFEYSATCLSVIYKLLSSLIPFASL